jgi:predicted TPR repeat methyltransferase
VDHHVTLPATYFEQLYDQAPDPWSLADRWYEERKYAVTMASLPRRRFRRAFEPGCSVGVLTEHLATRCDELIATDVADAPVASARQRLARYPHAAVRRMHVPEEWPEGEFDLIVLSEIGYYLSREALGALADQAINSLTDDGILLAVHWRHTVADYPLNGDEVHAVLRGDRRLTSLAEHVEADFRLDLLARPGALSVAQVEGLVDDGDGIR